MDFTPITTQEDFEKRLKERLEQKERAVKEQFSDYEELKSKVSDYEKQIASFQKTNSAATKQIDELSAKVQKYETNSVKTRVALEAGIPFELADKITGKDEAEMVEDAKRLAGYLGARPTAPLANPEPAADKNAEMKSFLRQIKEKGD